MDMIQELHDIKTYLLPRLSSILAITKEELTNLKQNIKKVGGYHSTLNKKTGNIIRNTG